MEGKATEVGLLLTQPFSVALGEESFTSQFVCWVERSVLGASRAVKAGEAGGCGGRSTGSQVDRQIEAGGRGERKKRRRRSRMRRAGARPCKAARRNIF